MLIDFIKKIKINNISIILLFSIICLIHWLKFPYNINESVDFSSYYYPAAQNIINGFPPEGQNSELGYRYPPGFPILTSIVIFISNILNIDFSLCMFIFSALCLCIASIVLNKISQEFFPYKISILTSIVMLTYPLSIWTLRQPNSENPFLTFFFLSILIYIKALKSKDVYILYYLSGLFLGISMLIRPIAIGVPFIFVLFFFFYRFKQAKNLIKSIFLSIVLSLGLFTVILPWETHVFNKENKIILLSSSGGAALYDGLTFNVNLKGYREKKDLPKDIDNLMEKLNKNLSLKSTLGEVISELKVNFYETPLAVIKLYIFKFIKTFYGTDTQKNEGFIIAFQLIYFSFIIFAIKKTIKNNFMENFEYFFILIFFYFSFMATISLSIVRYTFPVICLLFVYLPSYMENKKLHE